MREFMLMLHFIGLAMGVGAGFANLFLGMAGAKMDPDEMIKFRLNTFVLTRMGHIGLGLLIVSGGALMTPYWGGLGAMPLLIAKLVLVLVLAALVGLIAGKAKKAKQGDAAMHLQQMAPLGKMTLLTGLAIVVLAVLVFR